MRVLQLIDSLNPGGAERVAINYANALHGKIDGSYLCATREEGALKETVVPEIPYLFLKKRHALDLSALFALRKFITAHRITILHAHTTSYFFACLIKITYPKIRLIWHEHNGNRVNTGVFGNKLLYICSLSFNKIFTVNEPLKMWCQKYLACPSVTYVPNFVDTELFTSEVSERKKIIVYVANLRIPKNHLNLLEAFKKVNSLFADWKLYLIGKDKQDVYSEELKKFISKNGLQQTVILKGMGIQVETFLKDASIGVISSDSEGLPMALLEYGAAGLAVVSTKVGYCEKVIGNFGKTVEPKSPQALADALVHYIENKKNRDRDGRAFQEHIFENYSMAAVLARLITLYKN